ncbi:MAG: hypothetical protein ACFFEW_15795 [Candidatus Thorarchaeota archaeon]
MENLGDEFLRSVSRLCGREFDQKKLNELSKKLSDSFKDNVPSDTFGYRQLNEILLLCNERIVSKNFFRFLASGPKNDYDTISFGDFNNRINDFRKLAMLRFGSFRFAFNHLCRKNDLVKEFGFWVRNSEEIIKHHKSRLDSIRDIDPIDENDLHLLGYLTNTRKNKERRKKVIEQGQRNFETYLSWDYIDVYVATSMREQWEYVDVNRMCNRIFNNRRLKAIKIRYFDPTQNFHENSIAKSLIEGLMLKRAKCTLYFAQESDTMGKDSEMATTLAQGKPVIAYVPEIKRTSRMSELKAMSINILLQKAELLEKEVKSDLVVEYKACRQKIVELFESANFDEHRFGSLLKDHKKEYQELMELLVYVEASFYDKRANKLKYQHPLRFQIDLETGVANGVLVTRNPETCAEVIYKVLTNNLEFDILQPGEKIDDDEIEPDLLNYRLVEKATGCAFRTVTKHELLTNSFWNLYLLGDEENDH